MIPPIERYIRCSVTRGAWTVEPGLEWREGDDFEALSGDLEVLASGIAALAGTHRDPAAAGRRGEIAFAARWAGPGVLSRGPCGRWPLDPDLPTIRGAAESLIWPRAATCGNLYVPV